MITTEYWGSSLSSYFPGYGTLAKAPQFIYFIILQSDDITCSVHLPTDFPPEGQRSSKDLLHTHGLFLRYGNSSLDQVPADECIGCDNSVFQLPAQR